MDLGVLKAQWKERFFAVLMYRDKPPQATEQFDSYGDAVTAAKRHDPMPDAFKVEKLYERA